MIEKRDQTGKIHVTAPNGVTWTRRPEGTSTGAQLLQALTGLSGLYGDVSRQWNWWQEGRRDQERDRVWQILHEWDNGAPDHDYTEEEAEVLGQAELDEVKQSLLEDRLRRADLVARSYDEDREHLRLRLLRTESDAAFFKHVLRAPANQAQRENAEQRVAERQATADEWRRQLDDPEQVVDRHGYLPAERREMNLRSHMDCWRHPTLRTWAKTDRRRFNVLPGTQDEHEAGIDDEQDHEVISPVLMFTVSATCSWCRSMVFNVPPREGRSCPSRRLVDHPDGAGVSSCPWVKIPIRVQLGTRRANRRRKASTAAASAVSASPSSVGCAAGSPSTSGASRNACSTPWRYSQRPCSPRTARSHRRTVLTGRPRVAAMLR